MKGPIGMLLVGGGIILIVGLFTGKITFPGGAGLNPLAAVGGVDPNAPSGVIVNGKSLTNAQWRQIAGQNGA